MTYTKKRVLGQVFRFFVFDELGETREVFGATNWLRLGVGKNTPHGRNHHRAWQQGRVENFVSPSATLKQPQSFTPRGSAVKKPTPPKKVPRLQEAARLGCFKNFHAWVHVDKKQTKSPEPALRKKYSDFKLGKSCFYKFLEKNLKEGTIFPRPVRAGHQHTKSS
jgi:predicted DNA-binding transcriptional regulator AlpA